MKQIKKISNYSIVGGLGATLIIGLLGCEGSVQREGDNTNPQGETQREGIQKDGAFVIIEKDSAGKYQIIEEFPSKETRVVLRENGQERILSKEEIDALIKEEQAKIESGTSSLTKSPEEVQSNDSGMGLGGAILSSMAGAILGSYIGNKLFNNQNYQNQRSTRYQNPSAYERSVNSFNKAKTAAPSTKAAKTAPKKSGFFGGLGSNRYNNSGFGG